VVATRVGGIPEVVRDGETGYLVRPGDDGTLAAHLLRLLGNPAERRILGDKGRRWVTERFRLEDSVRRTLHFYRDLAGGRPKSVYQECEG
jgi:glycosyltransferase involved in cell wall biosynthesis